MRLGRRSFLRRSALIAGTALANLGVPSENACVTIFLRLAE
jgi:hypothetical protein